MLWYSLELPRRGDSNEYSQLMFFYGELLKNYLLIINKYPLYLFFWHRNNFSNKLIKVFKFLVEDDQFAFGNKVLT